jgi:hypothetical protein
MSSKVNVYVLRVHFINENVMSLYKQYQRDFGVTNSFMLLDTTNIEYVPSGIHNLITIDKEQAEAIDPLINSYNLGTMYYRAEAPSIRAADGVAALFGNFDYLWIIEYDLYCHGSFAEALKPCHHIEADLLAKGRDDSIEKRRFYLDPHWVWWGDLWGELAKMPLMARTGCFFPIVRMSQRFIETLRENLGRSTGFSEVYFSNLCVAYGLKYKTIPWICIGDVRFQPDYTLEELQKTALPNRLYHPVKQNPGCRLSKQQ